MSVCVIVPAAGSGSRFGSSIPKQFLELDGIPVIVRTLLAFQKTPNVSSIVIPADEEYHQQIIQWCAEFHITKLQCLVEGGTERQHSIFNALQTSAAKSANVILVHDAARPFVSTALVELIISATLLHGSAIPVMPVRDTIKITQHQGHHLIVHSTPSRADLRAVQTPQGFLSDILRAAYTRAKQTHFLGTDDASVVEYNGTSIYCVAGEENNIKITTKFDWEIARLILKQQKTSQ